MRWLIALLLALAPGVAGAQLSNYGPGQQPPYNATGPLGYQLRGLNGLSATTGVANPSVFVGPKAGLNSPSNSEWQVFVGYGAGEGVTAAASEVTAIGYLACNGLATGSQSVCLGTVAGWHETGTGFTALGSDAQRNTVGSTATVAVGTNSHRNGKSSWSVYIGTEVAGGNGSAITIGGTPTTGDVIRITLTSAFLVSSPAIVNYTVTSGDTTNAILATNLAAAITAAAIYGGTGSQTTLMYGMVSLIAGGPTTVGLDFPGTSATGWAMSVSAVVVSGAATETFTVTTGFTGSFNTIGGYQTLQGVGMSTAHALSLWGYQIAPWATTAADGSAIGTLAGASITSDASFDLGGARAGYSMRGTTGNTIHGARAAYGVTTGGYNSIYGFNDGSYDNCVTTGSVNLQLGYGACVPSATASNQGSIMNSIYLTGATGYGATVSPGKVGINNTAPGATLDILGADTSGATLALRVQNSTPTTRFSVANDGTIAASGIATFSALNGLVMSTASGLNVFPVASSTNITALASQNGGFSALGWSGASQIAFGTIANAAFGTYGEVAKLTNGGLFTTRAFQSYGTKFTISGCSAGTTVGGAAAGSFASGTTGACTVVITLNGATGLTATNGWVCIANNRTTPANLISQSASSTTTCTVTGTTVSGDVIGFMAMAY